MADKQVVVFELGGVRYGINTLYVQGIIRMVKITPIAEAGPAVEGIIKLCGQVVTVINIAQLLGLPTRKINSKTRIIVVNLCGKKFGLIVDQVLEIAAYNDEEMESALGIEMDTSTLQSIVKKNEHLWLVLILKQVV